MKGTVRQPQDPTFRHLIQDYRDPPPRALPPVPKYELKEKSDVDSINNVKSNDGVWDRLRELELLLRPRRSSYKDLRDRQRNILLDIPTLTDRQLRRKRTPAKKYLKLELMEDGYFFAAYLLTYLIQKDIVQSSEKLKEQSLCRSPGKLEMLADLLKEMSESLSEDRVEDFVSVTFRCGLHLEQQNQEDWWLASEFYQQAADKSTEIQGDFGYSTAVINYIYGKFLLFKENNPKKAIECLSKSRELSIKKNWNVDWITGVKDEGLAENSLYLCFLSLLYEAENYCYDRPEWSMEKAEEAAQLATNAKWHKEAKEAWFDFSIYACQAKKFEEALSTLHDLRNNCSKIDNLKMYISVHLLLAECLIRTNNNDKALGKLVNLVDLAKEFKLPWLRALSYRYIGQIFLTQNKPERGLRYLKAAAKLNLKLPDKDGYAICEYLLGCTKRCVRINQDATLGEASSVTLEEASEE